MRAKPRSSPYWLANCFFPIELAPPGALLRIASKRSRVSASFPTHNTGSVGLTGLASGFVSAGGAGVDGVLTCPCPKATQEIVAIASSLQRESFNISYDITNEFPA